MSYTGDFQGGEREARQYQQHYPSDDTGYLALAFAQLGQGQLSQAEESYSKLEQFGAHGASLSNWGLADLYLYQGRFTDAVHSFEKGANSDLANKDNDSAAEKFAELAYTHLSMRQKGAAIAAAEKALANSQTVKVRFLAGLVFAETGQQAKAQELATKLAAEVQSEAGFNFVVAGLMKEGLLDGDRPLGPGAAATLPLHFLAGNGSRSCGAAPKAIGR